MTGRTRGLTRKGKARHGERLPAEDRRESIVEAALAVFGASSYASATTAAIAAQAGISEPILYRHFASKKDLYVACLDESWGRLRAAWERAAEEAEPGDRLVAFSEAAIELSRGGTVLPPTLWMQAFAEAGVDADIRRAVRRVVSDVHDVLEAALVDAQRHGAVHADRDPDAEAWIIVSSLLLHALSKRVGGLLDADGIERVRAQRLRWLSGA